MMNIIDKKTSKKGLVEYLREAEGKLTGKKNKSLADRVKYSLKKFAEDATKVLKEDLLELALEVQTALTPAPVENAVKSVKKLSGKSEKAVASAEETKEDDSQTKDNKKVLKSTKTKTGKVKAETKEEKTPDKKQEKPEKKILKPSEKAIVLADQFPPEIEVDGIGKLKLNTDIKDMDGLRKAIESGKNLFFAMYWSPRHLKQFVYDQIGVTTEKVKSFPNDLDISQLVYVSDAGKVAYVISVYSEVLYTILPQDLEIAEDGLRYSAGVEFHIYEAI